MNITLVLHNIRSTYNVGAILRTCDGLGVLKVIYSGYTPRYNSAELLPHLREKLNHQIEKSALGAELTIHQEHIDNLPEWLETQKTTGTKILGLENNLAQTELPRQLVLGTDRFSQQLANFDEAILILGEEVSGIPIEIRNLCNFFLEVPMRGRKESFNVSIAAAIALWELTRYIKIN